MAETGTVSSLNVTKGEPPPGGVGGPTAGGVPPGDSGLVALAAIAAQYRIAADPGQMSHELGLGEVPADAEAIVRAARRIGLKSEVQPRQTAKRLKTVPLPAIVGLADGTFAVLTHRLPDGKLRVVSPLAAAKRSKQPRNSPSAGPG